MTQCSPSLYCHRLICDRSIMALNEKVTSKMKALGFASLALIAAILVFGVGLLALAGWQQRAGATSTMSESTMSGQHHSSRKMKYSRRIGITNQTSPSPTTLNPTPSQQIATTKPTTSNPRTARPTSNPITQRPTRIPITQRPTKIPTAAPTERATISPTAKPTLSEPIEPLDPNAPYFNFNTTEGSQFGPSVWNQVDVSNSYWSEFGLVTNQCNDRKVAQSPIDVCTTPEKQCLEFHETRPNVRFHWG